MGRGRKTKAVELVSGLEGSAEAKEKLRVIVANLRNEKTIPQASESLRTSEPMVYRLRQRMMQAALRSLEPQPIGRPRREEAQESARVKELEEKLEEMERALRASEARATLNLALPQRRKRVRENKKK